MENVIFRHHRLPPLFHCSSLHRKFHELADIEKETYYERLKKQQHLATVGQIAASIAHDIRNPLTAILGFVQLMEKNEKSESNLTYYSIIRSEIKRINNLIQEVLLLSKSHTIDINQKENVNLSDLMQRLVILVEPDALKNNIQIHFHQATEPIYVTGSKEKFHQVFLNLLRNALEAIQTRGEIKVELHIQNYEAVIHIADDGPGILDEDLPHLFTPFFTTKENGTGLGLPVCHAIIRSVNGKIFAKNRSEGGAKFTVIIPLAPSKTKP